MKILRIYLKLPPLFGGMEKHIYQLTKYQLSDGHYVKVLYNDGEIISNSDERICRYKLHKIKPQFIGVFIFYFLCIIRLIRNREKFDVVHIHGDWSSLIFISFIKRIIKAKVSVFSIHDQLSKSITHKIILPFFIRYSDLVFSTGYDTACKLENLSKKKVYFQPSGINELFFINRKNKINASDNEKFKIITVANLYPKKNVELIIEIAKILKNFEFVVIGDGSHKAVLQTIISSEDIDNVILAGFKTPLEIVSYYHISDCFLFTSYAEGTPTSILEAMSCGLPIVSSKAGGINHIIHDNKNGFIVDDFDAYNYANKILLLKNDNDLRLKIGFNNKILAENYRWKKVAGFITEVVEKEFNEKN